MCQAAEKAFDFIAAKNGNTIVVMGHSLGCGPTLWLASRPQAQGRLGGAILKSPFASTCSLLGTCCHPNCCCFETGLPCCDLFKNMKRVQKVNVPVFLIHSDTDEMMNIKHAELLYENLKPEAQWEPWWLSGERHANLPRDARQFFRRLEDFLDNIENLQCSRDEAALPVEPEVLDDPEAELVKRFNLELYMHQYLLLNKTITNEPEMKARAKKKVALLDKSCNQASHIYQSKRSAGGEMSPASVLMELEDLWDSTQAELNKIDVQHQNPDLPHQELHRVDTQLLLNLPGGAEKPHIPPLAQPQTIHTEARISKEDSVEVEISHSQEEASNVNNKEVCDPVAATVDQASSEAVPSSEPSVSSTGTSAGQIEVETAAV